MPAVLYIITSFFVGAGVILLIYPYLENRLMFLLQDQKILNLSFLFFPASYLIGTLLLSWTTYFLAVFFRFLKSPLLLANLLSFLLAFLFIIFASFIKRRKIRKWLYEVKKYGLSLHFSAMERFIIIGSFLFWTFFIFRSLYMKGDVLHAGISAFSDFGAHLPVIRSFSRGNNFPAQYPHFPDGTIRYHFMFYFLAGNLEYLGLNLPWALNTPSILSLVSFTMLLYGLCTVITKRTLAGVLACVFFAFRSSFAFFTYASGFSGIGDLLNAIAGNKDASGNIREHIGNTTNESWGLWAQKVYVNQRHLAFAFGIFLMVLFLLLPLFMETIEKLKHQDKDVRGRSREMNFSVKDLFAGIFTTRDAWLPMSIIPCISAGLMLGLTAFWNGAAVIASISVLFVMAVLSSHKLEYLITAVITFVLSTLQSRIFVGSGTGAVSIKYNPGFLAPSGKISDIASYYTELLGILPYILLALLLAIPQGKRKWPGYLSSVLIIVLMIVLMPSIGILRKLLIAGLFAALLLSLNLWNDIYISPISKWLIPVFAGPIVLATTIQLTPDITVNHKYIILAVILFGIPVSDLLAGLFESRRKASVVIGCGLIFILTCTGIVDLVTLYNLDKNSVSYYQKEPVQVWAENETDPKDIFLTDYMTHYGAPMSILLAGRMVYSGYPYFTMTAGYDTAARINNMKMIYSAEDPEQLRSIAISEGISYIVIDERNRISDEYDLNEKIIYETFPIAFEDKLRDVVIFKVQ